MNARKVKTIPSSKGAGDGAGRTRPEAAALGREEAGALERHARIAEHAYYLAMARGFAPGHEVDDWLLAEREMDCQRGVPAA